jgi:hypothetical protein
MNDQRCWHNAVLTALDSRLRDAMEAYSELDVVVTCSTCGNPCRVWLYYGRRKPVLMVHEKVVYGEIDYYSWTGTEWWED